jgi:LmbE family N-acetylglucosaminyl deacetylase
VSTGKNEALSDLAGVRSQRPRYAVIVSDRELWGALDPSVLAKVLVVSPHFDDAALGAAHLLTSYPDSTVVTVLGGRPPSYPEEVTEWDSASGFTAQDDVVAIRQEEDRAAMASMQATPIWLDFPDHQYLAIDQRPTPSDIAPSLQRAIEEADPSAVFLPMGLANPDHILTHDAGLLARSAMMQDGRDRVWFCYEDAGYKHLPGLLAWRVSKLFRANLWPTPAIVPIQPDMDRKATAIRLYTSQIGPLERDHLLSERLGANVPEQYWRLDPPPRGWEALTSADELALPPPD